MNAGEIVALFLAMICIPIVSACSREPESSDNEPRVGETDGDTDTEGDIDIGGNLDTSSLDDTDLPAHEWCTQPAWNTVWDNRDEHSLMTVWDVWATSPSEIVAVGYEEQEGSTLLDPKLTPVAMHISDDGISELPLPAMRPLMMDLNEVQSSVQLSVWGTSTDNLYVVSPTELFHYDGDTWRVLHRLLGFRAPNAIWVGDKDTAVAFGKNGVALHLTAGGWRVVESEFLGTASRVLGTAADNVYAAMASTVLFNDGASWQPIESRLLHYDGTSWQPAEAIEAVVGKTARIFGSAADDMYILNTAGIAYHYDGSTCSEIPQPLGEAETPLAISTLAVAEKVLFANTSEGIFGYDGESWSSIGTLPDGSAAFIVGDSAVYGIWAAGENTLYVSIHTVQDQPHVEASLFYQYQDGTWQLPFGSADFGVTDVWAAPSGDVYVVENQTVHHYDGVNWTKLPQESTGAVSKIRGSDAGNLMTISVDDGSIRAFDGSEWTVSFDLPDCVNMTDVWGTAGGDVYSSCFGAAVLHYDGTRFEELSLPSDVELKAAWASETGELFAAGSRGELLHLKDGAWAEYNTEVQVKFSSLWGSGPADVFAWCDRSNRTGISIPEGTPRIWHFDGAEWLPMPSGVYEMSFIWADLAGSAADDVLLAGGESAMRHYDGRTWAEVPFEPLGSGLRRISALSDGHYLLSARDQIEHLQCQ